MVREAVDLAEKYADRAYFTQIKLEMAVLADSFALVEKHRDRLPLLYGDLTELYRDAQTVAESDTLCPEDKRQTLYRIYDLYFDMLAPLPYKLRGKLEAHKFMNRMRRVVKRGHSGAESVTFWREFGLKCGISFVLLFGCEILLLWVLDSSSPLALKVFLWIVFGGSTAYYFYSAYALEGRRIFLGLQKWLGFKSKPAEFNKPMDIWQYAKLAAPFGIAVLSALAKIYIR